MGKPFDVCQFGNEDKQTLIFYVNGKQMRVDNPEPEDTLLQFLRNECQLTGTKLGCAEGGCGACTVMVSSYNKQEDKVLHFSVNACLAPLVSLHGMAVTTVEGIGSTKTKLHVIQEKLAASHGSQCGFCTPGIVMSMYALLRNVPEPSQQQMEKAFEGNLCRCTGYRPILEGFKSFVKAPCAMGENCCKNVKGGHGDSETSSEDKRATPKSLYDPSQEPIFPPQLKLRNFGSEERHYKGERVEWFRPTDLQTLLKLKQKYPSAKLVCGNTEVGVEVKFKNQLYPLIIAPTHVPELNAIQKENDGIWFGASVSLTKLEQTLQEQIDCVPEQESGVYREIVEMLRWFAGHQIRNVSSMAGNLMTASPISDLNPLYLAAAVKIRLVSAERGLREVKLDEKFFISYRKIAVAEDEILHSIHIPRTCQNEFFAGYKQAHRKEDDIAIVNSGMRVLFEEGTSKVKEIYLAYGGMAPITKMCLKTSQALIGRHWDEDLLEEAIACLKADLPLEDNAPGGMVAYRRTLTISFFYKFYSTVKLSLEKARGDIISIDTSAANPLERGMTRGVQVYEEEKDSTGECWQAVPHKSAFLQCTGEAQYIDDLPKYKEELYMALVTSTVAHGKLISIDASEALQYPGVKDFISAKDIPGRNNYGVNIPDDLVFASEEVTCVGHVIGAILADTQRHAQTAAKKVKVDYEQLPALFTTEDAIAVGSFFEPPRKMWKGDVDKAFSQVQTVINGEIKIGGQEHFYLETHACLCIPQENGEMEVFCSTQNPKLSQISIGAVLNIPAHKVNVRVKRMGGGFGGKESRSNVLLLPAAVAARKHGIPVRCMLDRDEDMIITGGRHPMSAKYRVGLDHTSRVHAIDVEIYANVGNTMDLSLGVLERAMFASNNSYSFPNMRVQGWMCKTNLPSNTAFRGFGGPQGMFVIEHIMSEIASRLDIPGDKFRDMHLCEDGDVTHYGQLLTNCTVKRCWTQVLEQSDYRKRQEEICAYNSKSRWKKRGITIVPTIFGLSFTVPFLNQAGALVHIYTDGSVLVHHGGTEMGQGLFTKMIQVASTALGISANKIHTMETSTATVPNTSPTAASVSSDLNGAAVVDACNKLNKRLKPVKTANPDHTWEQLISTAYLSRISLSATGYHSTPGLVGMDWETSKGNPFSYFSSGAAVSEVEIDCLTGDHQVLRSDIVMDVGKSLNPAIDIGQVEGGFVQGYGLFCLEQNKIMSKTGHLLTRGPGAYKIPGFGNIPQEFNVSLLKDAPNVKAVYSSKAVGEPPLFLAASVFFAIKLAIQAARKDAGKDVNFRLDSPCTPERIRMACADTLTDQFMKDSHSHPHSSFFVEP
ncbi:xanthine dehydrogenase/oxidase-like [Watersipora subatra]|uniref:xanthine dehydrogenase/oxidase-like n=1 Tax=Watersipora subatra TaxID=2589382 RepID=UPI00355B2EB8